MPVSKNALAWMAQRYFNISGSKNSAPTLMNAWNNGPTHEENEFYDPKKEADIRAVNRAISQLGKIGTVLTKAECKKLGVFANRGKSAITPADKKIICDHVREFPQYRAPRSPDMSVLDYWFWNRLKVGIREEFEVKPASTEEIKKAIIEVVKCIEQAEIYRADYNSVVCIL